MRRTRLILLPYAGGGANIYRAWPHMVPADLDVRPVQLPGRERRFSEPALADMETLLDALVPAVLPLLDLPLAVFGHSMGACIAHALALRLRAMDLPQPLLLAVSGRGSPLLPQDRPGLHTLPEPDFLAALQALGGTPAEVLDNRELLDLVLPTLRADFALVASYRPAPSRLDCPILVLGGHADEETTPAGLKAWSDCTTAETQLMMVPGGHFFVDTARADVVSAVQRALVRLRRSG